MSQKRSHSEAIGGQPARLIRRRLSLSAVTKLSKSRPSAYSTPNESAVLIARPHIIDESVNSNSDEDSAEPVSREEYSELSSSSEEESENSCESEEVRERNELVTIHGSRNAEKSDRKDAHKEVAAQVPLLERLKTFLPQIQAANHELEAERTAGTLDERNMECVDVERGGGYIEMDLGLGVLEEKRNPGIQFRRDTSSESSGDEEEDACHPGNIGPGDENIMDRLLGKIRDTKKLTKHAGIEEVGDS